MEVRQLGRVGPSVSAIGLGCMPMSGVYGNTTDAEGIAAIHRALDLGISLLDTADVYGNGHNEQLVGQAIRDRRDEVVFATKFGNVRDARGRPGEINGRPEYVREACEASLTRLGVDTIDLYQQHRVDPDTPIEETVGAMAELVHEGKVRYLGLSEALAPDLRRAAAVHPISSLQSEYSLLERSVEQRGARCLRGTGIGFLPFSPLLRGLLAGSLAADSELDEGDFRSGDRFPRVGPEHRSANARLARVVSEIADEHSRTPAPGGAGMATRPPTLDRADPRNETIRVCGGQRSRAPAHFDRGGPGTTRGAISRSPGRPLRRRRPTPDWVSPPRSPERRATLRLRFQRAVHDQPAEAFLWRREPNSQISQNRSVS